MCGVSIDNTFTTHLLSVVLLLGANSVLRSLQCTAYAPLPEAYAYVAAGSTKMFLYCMYVLYVLYVCIVCIVLYVCIASLLYVITSRGRWFA
jgi:hypothetical protein